MTPATRLEELLSRYQRLRAEGREVSLAEMCRDCPELLPQLEGPVRALEQMAELIAANGPSPTDVTTDVAAAADSTPGVDQLVLQWGELRRLGRAPQPEELCRDHPDLLAEVRRRIEEAWGPTQAHALPLLGGRYRLDALLGRGGFGEVWKAHDLLLHRDTAIKSPRLDGRHAAGSHPRALLAEARKLAALKHPGLVPVFDAFEEGGAILIVSEYIDGPNLARHAEGRRLPRREAVSIVVGVAEALHYAHLHHFVHRDVKPGNVLIDRHGVPHLTDFGLAVSEEELRRETPAVMGTYAYMPPEQMRGESHLVDARSDVYSLGVILYELLTGRLPFLASKLPDLREEVLHRPPRPPRTIDDTIPPELERICLKCLAKRMEDRYTTAADLAADLRAWLDPPPRPRRTLLPAVVGVVGLALLAAVVSVYAPGWRPDGPPPTVPQRPAEEPPPPPLLPGGTYDLLARKPRVVLWEGKSPAPKWDADAAKRGLSVACTELGMLQLAEVGAEGFDLELTLLQTPWVGGIGVYFDEQVVSPGKQARSDVILLDWFSGGEVQRLTRGLINRNLTTPRATLGRFDSHQVPRPHVGEHRLRLVAGPKGVEKIYWDGAPVAPKLWGSLPQTAALRKAGGAVGVFVQSSATTLIAAQVRIPPRPPESK